LFNLVPILVIPAAELALPVLIKIFPGFLPTTYLTRLQVEMKMREKLRKKRQVCVELQDSTEKIFQQIKLESMPEAFSRDVQPQQIQAWWNRMKAERLAVDEILHFARLFHELFALEKLPREKLQRIARFLGIRLRFLSCFSSSSSTLFLFAPHSRSRGGLMGARAGVGEGGSTQYLIHKINVKIARLRSDDEDILEVRLPSAHYRVCACACACAEAGGCRRDWAR
jgi:glucose-6-phosphate dehydrogenase assembly protein OpcA